MEKQEKLFNDIVNLKYRVQSLAAFVQNPFDKMLEDGTATKELLIKSIPDIVQSFNKFILDVNKLKAEVVDLVSEVINDCPDNQNEN